MLSGYNGVNLEIISKITAKSLSTGKLNKETLSNPGIKGYIEVKRTWTEWKWMYHISKLWDTAKQYWKGNL